MKLFQKFKQWILNARDKKQLNKELNAILNEVENGRSIGDIVGEETVKKLKGMVSE